MTNSHSHIVGDGENARMCCDHCGESVPMPYGVVQWVCGVMRAFNAAHRCCKLGSFPAGLTRIAGDATDTPTWT
jgi:hypothetical protein